MVRALSGLLTAACLFGAAPPAHAFVRTRTQAGQGVPIFWDRRCIPYHINERGSEDTTFLDIEKAAQRSYSAWQNVQCSDEELSYQGKTNVELVGYKTGEKNVNMLVFQEGDDWSHQSQIIALTTVTFCSEVSGTLCEQEGKILDADIEMNGRDFTFSTSPLPRPGRYDVQNTVTHEAGHFLGLDHSLDPVSTMYATAPAGEREKQTLEQDDVNGLCTIYPHVSPVPACEPFDVTGEYLVDDPYLESNTGGGGGNSACSTAPGGAVAPGPMLLLLAMSRLAIRRRRRSGSH